MRFFRLFIGILALLALLAGCTKAVSSDQPGTSMPTEANTQVPSSGSATLPVGTEPVSDEIPQIPHQNTLQSGDPRTLSDWVFTNYEQTFSWRDGVNNFCSVSITLPALVPVSEFAVRFNEEIRELGNAYLEEITDCQKQEASNILSRVSYGAYLHDEILSIVLIENTTFDYTAYHTWSFDLEDRKPLRTAELCDELLDMDYPEFILATNAMTAHHFKEQFGGYIAGIENQPTSTDSYFETEPPAELAYYYEILEQISYDTVGIQNRRLFVGENGRVMLIYDAPSLASAASYPTVIPFDMGKVDWKKPSEETAYGELFRLTKYVDGKCAESYAAILLDAFLAEGEDFVKYAARATTSHQEEILSFLHYGLSDQQGDAFQRHCRDLLSENDWKENEIALLNRMITISGT